MICLSTGGHAQRLDQALGVVDLGARDRDRHRREADAHRLLRLRLDEGERRLRVEVRAERGRAELQRIGRAGRSPSGTPQPAK